MCPLRLKSSLKRFVKAAVASFISAALIFVSAHPPAVKEWETYFASALMAGVTGLVMFLEKYTRWQSEIK